MQVLLIKPTSGIQYDITNACASYTWSGSASEASRQFEFNYLNSPYESSLQLPSIEIGDYISFSDNSNTEVFYGQILAVERSSQIGTITYTAYDAMRNLLNSKGNYVFANQTAEAIAAKVCNDIQMNIRYLQPTGVNIASMVCEDMTFYDIIMAAYTKAHKISGDKYFAMIYKRGLGVYKSEWIVSGFTLSDTSNIYSSSITEEVSEIVNRVCIYDDKGTLIGEVKDDNSINSYGTYQQIYKQEEGVSANDAANTMLKSLPTQSIKISAIGDINCLSCYFVQLTDGATGLSGRYWISSDSHKWENGVYTMELELTFDSLMTEVEAKEAEKKK